MTAKEQVATNIRTIARARHVTMRGLSQELGFKNEQNLYNRLNSGNFSVEELAETARILDVEPGDLFGDPLQTKGRARQSDLDVQSSRWIDGRAAEAA